MGKCNQEKTKDVLFDGFYNDGEEAPMGCEPIITHPLAPHCSATSSSVADTSQSIPVTETRPRERMGQSFKKEANNVLFDGFSNDPTDALMDFESVIEHPLSSPIDIQAYCTLVYRCVHFKSRGPCSDFYSSPRSESEIREGARAALREKESNRGFFLDEFPCPPGKPSTTTLWTWSEPRKSFMPRFSKSPLDLLEGVTKVFGSYHFILKTNIRAFYPPFLLPMSFADLLKVTEGLYKSGGSVIIRAMRPQPWRDATIHRQHYWRFKRFGVVDLEAVPRSAMDEDDDDSASDLSDDDPAWETWDDYRSKASRGTGTRTGMEMGMGRLKDWFARR
ncbi:hypothetical protein L198_02501 [Cryptococcus wingfieldii CBS 7118]|uniref:Uncharacterized protein n=1 Tax=Cryptococcus wingfieldii CBS 7118 TaxID=1295528 RepID=A0A1E3JS03_9TREE|nr:hypothetical protein L198_02501 [Cryptococcus wingfieldii CBS 7118]ODO03650.1 hypothetical protein L198_02501 [Cryptococcus wingfieldii CBS 7118]